MKIAVIGAGYVGLTTACVLAELDNDVFCIDIDEAKIMKLNEGYAPIYEEYLQELIDRNVPSGRLKFACGFSGNAPQCDVYMIAVGTPTLENWEIDLSQVISVAEELPRYLPEKTVVMLKSTVPAGTNEMIFQLINSHLPEGHTIELVSNPEFLREGQAVYDTFFPDRIVIGSRSAKGRDLSLKMYKKIINAKYEGKFTPPSRGGERNPVPVIVTNPQTAELIKYAANAFLATKISFINEMSRLTESFNANIDEVARGIGLDRRIGESFLKAGIGFGGSCFPKDTKALSYQAVERGYSFPLLKAVIEVNQLQRFRFLQRIIDKLGNVRGKRVALLGLAFKPGTDDVRESPGIDIMRNLQFRGAQVRAHDPLAMKSAKKVAPNAEYCKDPYDAARDADVLALITDWPEYLQLDWSKIKKLMKNPLVFDGRNLLDPVKMAQLGFEYYSVGR